MNREDKGKDDGKRYCELPTNLATNIAYPYRLCISVSISAFRFQFPFPPFPIALKNPSNACLSCLDNGLCSWNVVTNPQMMQFMCQILWLGVLLGKTPVYIVLQVSY